MKRVKYLIATLLLAFGITLLTSCDVKLIDISKVQGAYDLSGVEFNDATFTYDGKQHSIEVSGQVPEGLDVEYTGNKQTNVGWHKVTAEFSSNGTVVGSKTAYIRIVKSSLTGVSLVGGTYPYTGEIPDVKITGELPAGVSVKYSSNLKADPGTYYVAATFSGPEGYELPYLSCEVVISDAKFEASDAVFSSNTFFYDGNKHSLEVVGVPGFVTVTYTNNEQTEIGTYTVTAHFESAVCSVPDDMTATLTILPPSVLSQVNFKATTVTYNGSVQKLEATNLPDGITVSYSNNNNKDVGSYEVTAMFVDTKDISNILPSMTATLTIEKANYDMSNVEFGDKDIIYDGANHTVEATNLPDGVTATYTYRYYQDSSSYSYFKAEEKNGNVFSALGLYLVTAHFETKDPNYNTPEDMTARFEIMYGDVDVTFVVDSCMYDGEEHGISIEGTLPSGVTVTGIDQKHTDAGEYQYSVYVNGGKSYKSKNYTLVLKISKYKVNLAEVSLDLDSFNYIRGHYGVELSSELDNGVVINYSWNDEALADTGKVTVKLDFQMPDEKNYEPIDAMFLDIDTTQIEQKITFDPDGGTMTTTEMSLVEFTQTGGPIEPTKEGYDFLGWAYVEDGEETELTSSDISSMLGNVTLKATWIDEKLNRPSYVELSDGTLEITGIGDFRGTQLHIRENYDGKTVTRIGNDAFKNNTRLRCLYLPSTVKSLGTYAISGLSKLEVLDTGSNISTYADYALYNNTTLTELIYDANKITSLGTHNFTSLKIASVTVPSNLTIIPEGCFATLPNVTSFTIPSGVTTISDFSVRGLSSITSLEIPSGVTYIGKSSINGMNALTSIVIPSGVTELPAGALSYNDELTSVTIPSGVTSFGNSVLRNNPKLTSISLPSALTSIGNECFSNSGYTSLTIPANVTSIGTEIAKSCNDMTSFVVASNNTTYSTVNNVLYSKDKSTLIYYPNFITSESYTLPNETIAIGNRAFNNNQKLKKLTNTQNVETIGEYAFYYSYIEEFTFGSNLTTIGKSAFMDARIIQVDISNCTSEDFEIGESAFQWSKVETLVLPSTIKSIPYQAFAYCYLLTSVDLKNVETIAPKAFVSCNKLETITALKVVEIGPYAFRGTKIRSVYAPVLEKIGLLAFGGTYDYNNETQITIDHNKDITVESLNSYHYEASTNQGTKLYGYITSPNYVFMLKSSHGKIIQEKFIVPVGVYYVYYDPNNPNMYNDPLNDELRNISEGDQFNINKDGSYYYGQCSKLGNLTLFTEAQSGYYMSYTTAFSMNSPNNSPTKTTTKPSYALYFGLFIQS